MACFAWASANRGDAASVAVISSTHAFSSGSSTHFQIRPQSAACSASTLSGEKGQADGARRPISRGRKYVPPVSGMRPILQNGSTNTRGSRCDHDVAGQRQIRAGPCGDTIHRGNHRNRKGSQPAHERAVVLFDRLSQIES